MWWKAILIWFVLMVGAIANGAVRIKLIIPFTGEPIGHVISTALLCVLILVITWAMIGWIGPLTDQQARGIGTVWLLLTLGFEFGAGALISHRTWPEMLADYNVLNGRVWVVVPIITFLAPSWMAKWRGQFP
ncbi:MAG: hypothetical protein IPP26_09305 [Flavobacteriales bacterium]|nr:hypothetical protein [Flavobacteriales bacterium]